jgi:hypothetical protein
LFLLGVDFASLRLQLRACLIVVRLVEVVREEEIRLRHVEVVRSVYVAAGICTRLRSKSLPKAFRLATVGKGSRFFVARTVPAIPLAACKVEGRVFAPGGFSTDRFSV